MAHVQQQEYCRSIQKKYESFFKNKYVLDIGSLDINGNNQEYFENCNYLGVDIAEGKNVDVTSKGHELGFPDGTFDVVISTECFEHDQYYDKTIKNIYRMLKPGGLFIFSCATTGRPEHGTRRTTPEDAPLLQDDLEWSDYYKNLTERDINKVLNIKDTFTVFEFLTNEVSFDLYFYGFKAGDYITRDDYSFLVNKSLDNPICFAQLFENRNSNPSEEESEKKPLTDTKGVMKFSFDLSNNENLKELRFDPINDYAIIKINFIQGDNKDLGVTNSNALYQDGNVYYFNTKDPIIYFSTGGGDVNSLIIEVDYIHVGEDAKNQIPNLFVQLLGEKSQEIEQKSQEIEQKSQEIEQKSQEIEQKSQEIEQKSQEIEQKSQEIEQKSQEIEQKSQEIEQKSQEIEQKSQEIESLSTFTGFIRNKLNIKGGACI